MTPLPYRICLWFCSLLIDLGPTRIGCFLHEKDNTKLPSLDSKTYYPLDNFPTFLWSGISDCFKYIAVSMLLFSSMTWLLLYDFSLFWFYSSTREEIQVFPVGLTCVTHRIGSCNRISLLFQSTSTDISYYIMEIPCPSDLADVIIWFWFHAIIVPSQTQLAYGKC